MCYFILVGCPKYKRYWGRRVQSVTQTITLPTYVDCTTLCNKTDGCLAVNILQNGDVICQLTTGLSNKNEMIDMIDLFLLVKVRIA